MLEHRTKNKGDIGLAIVIADLTKKGFYICLPISEHLPFDLIALNSKGTIKKIQVKYVTLVKGTIRLQLRNISSSPKGYIITRHDIKSFDGYAIYCPETNKVYYVSVHETLGYNSALTLRAEGENHSSNNFRKSCNYENPEIIFDEIIQNLNLKLD